MVRPDQRRAAQACRLERVLAAMRHQAAADERDVREAVEQPELAHRVGDVDPSARWPACWPARCWPRCRIKRRRRGAERPAGVRQPGRQRQHLRPALRVAGAEDGQQARVAGREVAVRGQHHRLLARVGAGGQQHGARADLRAQRGQCGLVGRQRARGPFQVAELAQTRGPARAQPRRIPRALRQDECEAAEGLAQQRRREASPARGRALREAGVGQRRRHAAGAQGRERVRPQLALDEHGGVGAPSVEEPRDPGRHVERGEAVERAARQLRRQARREQRGGRDRAGGDEEGEARRGARQLTQQGDGGERLAHTHRVQPQQRPVRPRQPEPLALAQAGRVLPPPRGARAEVAAQRRCGERCEACPERSGEGQPPPSLRRGAGRCRPARAWPAG